MTGIKRKATKIIIVILSFSLIVAVTLNWYMTYRLEDLLRKRLSREVSKATNGFYSFSFDKLSIAYFGGELSIKGITLTPDSAVYSRWKALDSLPDTYVDIHIGEIHFKGINLAWRRNFRDLDFALFEVKYPDVKIFSPNPSSQKEDKEVEYARKPTLYENISKYMNVIKVKKINLDHANISYLVTDSVSSIKYALTDASFHAYGFLWDENSSISGKLLYCDNFDFMTHTPQELLSSNDLKLDVQHIRLSTTDSIIHIEGASLLPQAEHWENRTTKAGSYVKAEVENLDVKGIDFQRKNARNYLNARSFKIESAGIQYYTVIGNEPSDEQQTTAPPDTSISRPWSLYGVISPILKQVSIDKIGVERTKFNYTVTHAEHTDIYTLNNFEFNADNFLVDSLSEKDNKFLYVQDFELEALNMNGLVDTKNVNVNVGRLFLSTIDKQLSISDIEMIPLKKEVKEDYIWGRIRSIRIDGLDYNNGIKADLLNITSANLNYFNAAERVQKEQTKENKPTKSIEEDSDEEQGLMHPYADYISIKEINVVNTAISFHDRKENNLFSLKNIHFNATNFLIDDNTKRNSYYSFTYGKLNFSFSNFDNYLPGKEYRLQIKEGTLSSVTSKIKLRDVKLIPQEKSWAESPDTYLSLSASAIEVDGFNDTIYIKDKYIDLRALNIDNPKIEIVKVRNSAANQKKSDNKNNDMSSALRHLAIGVLKMKNADIKHLDKTSNDSLHTKLNAFALKSIAWDVQKKFRIDECIIESPHINYVKNNNENNKEPVTNEPPSVKESLSILGKDIQIGKFSFSDISVDFTKPDLALNFKAQGIEWVGMNWNAEQKESSFALASANILNPIVSIQVNDRLKDTDKLKDTVTIKTPPLPKSKDIYAELNPYIGEISIGKFNIVNAFVNYAHTSDGKNPEHKALKSTNLSIEGLALNTALKKVNLDDVRFNTKDFSLPVADGFYTIAIGSIDLSKKDDRLQLTGLRLIPAYPKMEFAHQHPRHKDWFDVGVGSITLSGFDYPAYFSKKEILLEKLEVKDVMLQNFKNQKIEIQHNIMPMIYEGLQKLPVKYHVNNTDVFNFSVIYEELTKGGNVPGKITFMGMDAKISGISNIVTRPQQYIQLDANGKLMGSGFFAARWDIPVDSLNDHFRLGARIYGFDLTDLNQLITPMAPVEIKSGILKDLIFQTDASSEGAFVDMLFLYNDLEVTIFKNQELNVVNKLYTRVANIILRNNNPNNEKSDPRTAHLSIERNAYHSTFNYFWQILQPPLVESVGISQRKQNFAKKVSGFIGKIKGVFKKNKKKEEPTHPKNKSLLSHQSLYICP